MQVDALALALRPRPMAEAADLGVLLVHRYARSVARTCWPVGAGLLLVALALIEVHPWAPTLFLFWIKPLLDRGLLFVHSRAVFGQETLFADLWQQRRTLWWRNLPAALTVWRLSPWRSYTLPITQLEGQRGAGRRQRRAQLLNRRRGAAAGMHFVFSNIELVLLAGITALALWFAPAGTRDSVWHWLLDDATLANNLFSTVAYALVVFLLEPFYVAAGFLMYLNRRVELEAWDIEQEFRRAFA